ncbi:type IX secretion system membrane protein PorP/SprF [Flavobacteriaceae bacterium R38]|nr:type IX secretion system membrane protein PorP/SprF [Flavobacteriaceae bacterium R38]
MSLLFGEVVFSQRTTLPIDWRQHNLSKYNANIINPALSFVRSENTSLSLWGRLQWVGIEDAPTTYLINYSGRVGKQTGAGIALFQHNIGLFTDSGLMVNYARGIQLARRSWLTLGINLIGSQRGLNQASFITPEPDPVLLANDKDFILAVMPGINLTINDFNFGFTSENLFDYNFSTSEQQTEFSDKIFLGYVSYDYHLKNRGRTAWNNSVFRTTLYTKSIPEQDTQYGVQALIDVPSFGWAQAGYNNFFGISGGLGAKVSDGIVVGFLIETGTSTTRAFGSTYEVTAAIEFGKRNRRKDQPISFKEGPKPKPKKKNSGSTRKNTDDSNNPNDLDKVLSTVSNDKTQTTGNTTSNSNPIDNNEKVTKDTLQLDDKNIQNVSLEKLKNFNKDTDQNVLNKVFKTTNANPRYKAVDRIDGVEYGFYLVVNVFGEKRYFELFMKLLSNQGLEPKYFFNKENNYYYVYLRKYDKLSNIERDRRTNFNGKYSGETWILWVRHN